MNTLPLALDLLHSTMANRELVKPLERCPVLRTVGDRFKTLENWHPVINFPLRSPTWTPCVVARKAPTLRNAVIMFPIRLFIWTGMWPAEISALRTPTTRFTLVLLARRILARRAPGRILLTGCLVKGGRVGWSTRLVTRPAASTCLPLLTVTTVLRAQLRTPRQCLSRTRSRLRRWVPLRRAIQSRRVALRVRRTEALESLIWRHGKLHSPVNCLDMMLFSFYVVLLVIVRRIVDR